MLILFSHLRLDLPKGLFPVGLPVKILKALLPSPTLDKYFKFIILHFCYEHCYEARGQSRGYLYNNKVAGDSPGPQWVVGPEIKYYIS